MPLVMFKVEELPDVPKKELEDYISEALKCWGGQLSPDDELFGGLKVAETILPQPEKPGKPSMRLWLLETTSGWGQGSSDYYQGAIVAARSITEAKRIHPDGGEGPLDTEGRKMSGSWPLKPRYVTARRIGLAKPGTKPGVVLSAFYGV